jgi:GxxExxY protein
VALERRFAMHEDDVARTIVDAAFKVHKTLGPGLLESVYDVCLAHELSKRGLAVVRQRGIPVVYDSIRLNLGFRADMVVEDLVVVETKSVDSIAMIHRMQLLTYLRLMEKRLGLLLNFNTTLMKDGIRRVVNGLAEP